MEVGARDPLDPYKFLKIVPNPDGSLTRLSPVPLTAPVPGLSRDVPLNPTRQTHLRLYLPHPLPSPPTKLPVLLYIHGGGFILFSAASAPFDVTCARLSSHLPALVVSLDHRLAPEHPLPAAYDDAVDALLWLRDAADPWVRDHADLARCFVLGTSSGGNVAFRAGMSARPLGLNVAGVILDQPFYGGVERTESEVKMRDDRIVPLVVADLMWCFALPDGADRDHEYCNPDVMMGRVEMGTVLPRCLVRGHAGDPLIDRQRELARLLEGKCEELVVKIDEEGFHGVELFDKAKADVFLDDVKEFMCPSGSVVAAAASSAL
ncbi:putative carboxylesterase 8 [Acorus calamus]|uniref:Carboxylesterase 8 n=1 Tax=Acorus calamus TaxID=4465 RepID=A0AAV9CL64_ACOCL|nr:putative carboxylesterase 8 [Acorus calamus]